MTGLLFAAVGFAVGSLSGAVVLMAMWRPYRRARQQARMREAALKAALDRLVRVREELRTCRERAQFASIAESMPEVAGVGRRMFRRQTLRRVR